jgi:excisionase family DNA binding protein
VDEDKLLTIAEAASMLSVPVSYIYRMRTERRGPKSIRLGPQIVRYKKSDITAYLSECVESNHGSEEGRPGVIL